MPTPTKGRRLGGSAAHERLILANLAQSLFEHGKVSTTLAKAKRVRPVAEKLITAAKKDTLASRRRVMRTLSDKDVVHTLFAEIGPSFATRDGGYTRIVKMLPRKGDNAPMAVIELIDEETVSASASRVARAAASKRKAAAQQSADTDTADNTPAESAAATEPADSDADGADGADAGESPEPQEPATDSETSETDGAVEAADADAVASDDSDSDSE